MMLIVAELRCATGRRLLTLSAIFLAFSQGAIAAPDSLDVSYGDRGIARLGNLDDGPHNIGSGAGRMFVMSNGETIAIVQDEDRGYTGLVKVTASGTVDKSWGTDGAARYSASCVTLPGALTCPRFLYVFPDASRPGYFVVAQAVDSSSIGLIRFDAYGILDATYGDAGKSFVREPCSQCSYTGFPLAVQDGQGRIVITTQVQDTPFHITTTRFSAAGIIDNTFGVNGFATAPWTSGFSSFHVLPDGRFIGTVELFADYRGLLIARLLANGQPDTSFGNGGLLQTLEGDDLVATDVVALPGNRFLVMGGQYSKPGIVFTCVRADTSPCIDWGDNGYLLLDPGQDPAWTAGGARLLLQPDGKLLIIGNMAGGGIGATAPRLLLARLNADGSRDTNFAGAGVALAWSSRGTIGQDYFLRPDGTFVVAAWEYTAFTKEIVPPQQIVYEGHFDAVLMRFEGGDTSTPREIAEGVAAEYYNEGYGHYFITASAPEVSALNRDFPDWAPTGRQFKVWTGNALNLAPVCRFFSGASFAPKSSHFYTPYPAECAALKIGNVWEYEGLVFNLRLPASTPGGATCATGTRPLYRLYNNGQGGAPNHRYTDDPNVVEEMSLQGWQFEGDGITKVFACIPGD